MVDIEASNTVSAAPSLVDLLQTATPKFDPLWYQARYRDLLFSDMDAAEHFLDVGSRLGRGTGPLHTDLTSNSGIAKALARRRLVGDPIRRNIVVSYCIPVMNRRKDLEVTLAENLAANQEFRERVEFIVLAFENSAHIVPWIHANFADSLADGYLRIVQRPTLPHWHFGWAKNGFRHLVSGQYYSSLDADNFVTAEETQALITLAETIGPYGILHHFSGTWGDGSSGRVSLPVWVYRHVGYDNHFLPRQFDEVDIILSSLVRYPSLTIYRYENAVSVLDTENIRAFLRGVGLHPNVDVIPRPHRKSALNPKSARYVLDNAALAAQQSLNEVMCFLKHLKDPIERASWERRLLKDAQDFIDTHSTQTAIEMIFGTRPIASLDRLPQGGRAYITSSQRGYTYALSKIASSGEADRIVIVQETDEPIASEKEAITLPLLIGGGILKAPFWLPILQSYFQIKELNCIFIDEIM